MKLTYLHKPTHFTFDKSLHIVKENRETEENGWTYFSEKVGDDDYYLVAVYDETSEFVGYL